jgi:hypothetical protein
VDELTAFLRARIDEREAVARAATHGGKGQWTQPDADREPGRIQDDRGEVVSCDEGSPTEEQAAHIALNDPAHVLREVEAQRRVLARHTLSPPIGDPELPWDNRADCQYDGDLWPCDDILDLALPYKGHADWREEMGAHPLPEADVQPYD